MRMLPISFRKMGNHPRLASRLALVIVLQCVEKRSDQRAGEVVQGRLDWKYLLDLELTDPGFDASVLCEFRTRLMEHHAEERLREKMLTLFHQPFC